MHFVVRCIGHKKRELRLGDTLRIGSDPSNDLVIKDGTVASEHVVIRWDSDQAFPLVEVKSPVDINDEPREDGGAFITDYTTLGIGDFAVIFQPKGKKASKRIPRQKPPSSRGGMRLFSEDTTRIKGSFTKAKALHDVLCQLEADKRTGTLEVQEGDVTTAVMFGMGALVSVKREGVDGMEAVGVLFAIEKGNYLFSAEIRPTEENLNLSVKRLVAGIIR